MPALGKLKMEPDTRCRRQPDLCSLPSTLYRSPHTGECSNSLGSPESALSASSQHTTGRLFTRARDRISTPLLATVRSSTIDARLSSHRSPTRRRLIYGDAPPAYAGRVCSCRSLLEGSETSQTRRLILQNIGACAWATCNRQSSRVPSLQLMLMSDVSPRSSNPREWRLPTVSVTRYQVVPKRNHRTMN